MLVQLEQIPDRGLEVLASGDDAWVRDAATAALDATPVRVVVRLLLTRLDRHVRVQGRIEAEADRLCDRCGAALRLALGDEVDLFYSSSEAGSVDTRHFGGEFALESGDLDIGWFPGDTFDVAQVVSEQLALWLPDRLLCDAPGVRRTDPAGPCEVPPQDPGPDLERQSPFAGLRLPE